MKIDSHICIIWAIRCNLVLYTRILISCLAGPVGDTQFWLSEAVRNC